MDPQAKPKRRRQAPPSELEKRTRRRNWASFQAQGAHAALCNLTYQYYNVLDTETQLQASKAMEEARKLSVMVQAEILRKRKTQK